MKDQIVRILNEYVDLKKFNYRGLSDEEKQLIKNEGEKAFQELKELQEKGGLVNAWLINHGLVLDVPSEEYCDQNIRDAEFILYKSKIQLTSSAKKKLKNSLQPLRFLKRDYEYIRTYKHRDRPHPYEWFFHEIPKEDGKDKSWSIVNLYDNNISFWIDQIKKRIENGQLKLNDYRNYSELINAYFNQKDDHGSLVLSDLLIAMSERKKYSEKIFNRTWGGGRENESKFIESLPKNLEYRVFSGEKNIVDLIGIDLAVKCNGTWIPIQVKSNDNDARKSIPYKGYSTYFSTNFNSFRLISKGKGEYIYRSLSEICEPLDLPVAPKDQSKIPNEEPSPSSKEESPNTELPDTESQNKKMGFTDWLRNYKN